MFLIAELSTDSPPAQCTMGKFQVSKGGVAFRISNFVSRLEENITFNFFKFCLKFPLVKKLKMSKILIFSDFEFNF